MTFHSANQGLFCADIVLPPFPHLTGTTTAMPAEKDHHKDEDETSNASALGKHALEQENEPAANAEESGMCLCVKNSPRKTLEPRHERLTTLTYRPWDIDSDDDIGPMPAPATEETAAKKRKRGKSPSYLIE